MVRVKNSEELSAMKIALFATYVLLVSYASLSPGSGLMAVGSWDKLAHFLTYSVFAVLAYGVVKSHKAHLLVCLAIILYSGLMEVGQYFVPGRSMSAYDLLANTLGVLLGVLLVRFFRYLHAPFLR